MKETRTVILMVLGISAIVGAFTHFACTMPSPSAPTGTEFEQVYKEAWTGWRIYKLRHKPTGTCFVVIDPGGEGGGTAALAPKEVCDGKVER